MPTRGKSDPARNRLNPDWNWSSSSPLSADAPDKIHRDIEEYLYSKGYFYDRRKNYYKNIGKPIKRIVSIPFVAQAVMACALSDPANARARPSSLIKNNDTYVKVFSPSYPLEIFWKCPIIVRAVEAELKRNDNEEHRAHSNNLRFYVAMLWTLRTCNVPRPTVDQVAAINTKLISSESIISAISDAFAAYQELGGTDQAAKGTELGPKLIAAHKEAFLAAQASGRDSAVRIIASSTTNEPAGGGSI